MPAAAIDIPASLEDPDATFLPVAQMRQISRVTAVDGPLITAVVELGPGHWAYPQHLGTVDVHAEGIHVARVEAVLAVLADA